MKESADQQTKKETATKVSTPKQDYFLPGQGVTVQATSHEDAVAQAEKLKQQEKVGDE